MRPSTNWKDENIIDLTAEALGTLDEREQCAFLRWTLALDATEG